jgi:hypothetical protein
MARNALVTLAIGEEYHSTFKSKCHRSWETYANNIGCDLLVITDPLDTSDRAKSRSPAWQKLLVFSQPALLEYDSVCYADSDIIINPSAPDIFTETRPNSVGIVRSGHPSELPIFEILADSEAQRHRDRQEALHLPIWKTPFEPFGITEQHDTNYNTGVLLCRPHDFSGFFAKIYEDYEDLGSAIYNYEQWPLLHELLSAQCTHQIDMRFNVLFDHFISYYCGFLQTIPLSSEGKSLFINSLARFILGHTYFLHFAGWMTYLDLIDPPMLEHLMSTAPKS